MIRDIAFSVTFPPNEINPVGRNFTRSLIFDNGLTAITGPNEEGKSLILEMINFALFGTKALRGKAEDYKNLKLAMRFVVRGTAYLVTKKGTTDAKLFYDGDPEAFVTGVKPVNLKIAEIFGYGFEVFSVSNAILQDQLHAMGNMLPSERKRLVDSTVGLNVIDALIDWTNLQSNNARVAGESISSVLQVPVEPVKPEGYENSSVLNELRESLKSLVSERLSITAWLSSERSEPAPPVTSVVTSSEVLAGQVQERNERISALSSLKSKLSHMPEASATAEVLDEIEKQWVAYLLYLEKKLFMARHQEPAFTKDALDRVELDIYHQQAQIRRATEKKSLDAMKERLKLTCPECSHEWFQDKEAVEKAEKKFEETFYGIPEAPVTPSMSAEKLQSARKALLVWESVASTWNRLKDAAEAVEPSMTKEEVQSQRKALAQAEEREALKVQIENFVLPEDVTPLWQERIRYETALTEYNKQKTEYDTWVVERNNKRNRLAEIGEACVTLLPEVEARYLASKTYEIGVQAYNLVKAKYDANMALVVEKQAEAEEFRRGVNALRDLKARIKTYLLPSLNKVSSYLLQQMTNGVRRRIDIDEDFDIMVDGQRLDTLSGSGKSVANLAIRIGLGQVLTNRVFSVMMADEIDHAMDADRAGATAECLRGLQKSIGQILLVSHKYVDADHYIELGKRAA